MGSDPTPATNLTFCMRRAWCILQGGYLYSNQIMQSMTEPNWLMRIQRVIVHTQNKTHGKNSPTTQKKSDISYLETSRAFNA